jgi:alanine racemase
MSRETLAHIDLDALRHNLKAVRALTPASQVVAVVKADAYGHGAELLVEALGDADVLAVATVDELKVLRDTGYQGRLLLLEGFFGAAEYATVAELQAEIVVHEAGQVEFLRTATAPLQHPLWLKVNSGMQRLGFMPAEVPAVQRELQALSAGVPPVLMTHFACADEPGHAMNHAQIQRFNACTGDLPGARSLSNSAAVLNFSDLPQDYVRPGIMLYGISPVQGATGRDHGLLPVMTLGCRLLAINECKAGDTVGYGARFCCPEDMRIGVAGIGYGDGYSRRMPDGTPVLVNGRAASVAGRVSMDMTTLDLRGHDDAKVGDPVTLWGKGLPAETVAQAAGLIPYELICAVTGRVKRVTS